MPFKLEEFELRAIPWKEEMTNKEDAGPLVLSGFNSVVFRPDSIELPVPKK